MRHALIAGVAGVLLAAAPAAASAATPWVGLQDISGAAPAFLQPFPGPTVNYRLAVNPSGQAVAAWGSGSGLVAARRSPSGAWSTPQVVSTTQYPGTANLDVAMDAAGDATIVWPTTDATAHTAVAVSATSLAGAAFGAPQLIGPALYQFGANQIDIAMNASGQADVVYSTNSTAGFVQASHASSIGAAWSAPVTISNTSSGHGGTDPSVAIDPAGNAVAIFDDITGSSMNFQEYLRGVSRIADGDWATADYHAIGVYDGSHAKVVLDDADRATVVFRNTSNAVEISGRPALFHGTHPTDADPNFQGAESALASCADSSSATDHGVDVGVSSDGTRTIVAPCFGSIQTMTRAANASFASGAAPQTVGSTTASPAVQLAVASNGNAVIVDTNGTHPQAFTRSGTAATFGSAQALSDPDSAAQPEAVGIDAAGDAIALVGEPDSSDVPQLASILDVTPPTGGVSGPAATTVGTLVTFTSALTDPFGGLVGQPAWSTSDGASGSGATFDRTFTTPGTYKVTVTQSDLAGHVSTASLNVTVTAAPVATPTPTPAPSGGGQNVTTITNNTTTNNGGTSILMPPTAQPSITTASLSPSSFKVLSGKKGGSALTVTVSQGAILDGVVSLQTTGVTKTVGGASTCAAPPKKGKAKGKSCQRFVAKGTLHFGSVTAGTNKIVFTGKVGNKKLAPGKYTLGLQFSGASVVKTLSFTIKKSS